MMTPDCLICGEACDTATSEWTFETLNDTCDKVKRELPIIFLLRRILGVPPARLQSLLETIGNPSGWGVNLCDLCNRAFIESVFLYERLIRLHHEFNHISRHIRRRMETAYGIKTTKIKRARTKSKQVAKERDHATLLQQVIRCENEIRPSTNDITATDNLLDELDISPEVDGVLALLIKQEIHDNDTVVPEPDLKVNASESTESAESIVQQPEIDLGADEHDAVSGDDHDDVDCDYIPSDDEGSDGQEGGTKDISESEPNLRTDEVSSTNIGNEGDVVSPTPFTGPQPIKLRTGCGYQCPICNRRAISKLFCHGHILRSHFGDIKPYHCHLCKDRFRQDICLRRHLDDDHNGAATPMDSDHDGGDSETEESQPQSSKKYECELCPKDRAYIVKFKSLHSLETHKTLIHYVDQPGAKPKFTCKICKESFKIPSMLRQHMYRHDRNIKEEHINPHCHECNRTFKTMRSLNIHLESKAHTKPDAYPFQCELCPKGFYLKKSLTDHHAHEHYEELNIDPYKCSHCGRLLSSQKALDNHVRVIHTKETLLRCEPCDLGFMYIKSYERHVAIVHTKAKPLLCSFCPKTFANPSHLRTHMRVHTGEKPYKCQHCEKQYADRPTFRRHLETHGDKVYTCTICNNREFKVWHSYRTHMKTHNERIFKPQVLHVTKKGLNTT